MAEFLAGISPDIPWHVTAFHKDYKMRDPGQHAGLHSDARRRHRAERRAALRLRRQSARPGGRLENTRCAACGELLVARYGYRVGDYRITAEGRCPSCSALIPGRWRGPVA